MRIFVDKLQFDYYHSNDLRQINNFLDKIIKEIQVQLENSIESLYLCFLFCQPNKTKTYSLPIENL